MKLSPRQLVRGVELAVTPAIGRHLQAVLDEGDHPAHDDHLPERRVLEAQVTVPGQRHEDVGGDEQGEGRDRGRHVHRDSTPPERAAGRY